MIERRVDARRLEELRREAVRYSLSKWFVGPDPKEPASLATIQPGRRARRPIAYV
jgi:hypothetical protein